MLEWAKRQQSNRHYGFWPSWHAVESDIKVRFVLFGTFAGPDLFAECHSVEGKPRGKEGYTIDCSFKHSESLPGLPGSRALHLCEVSLPAQRIRQQRLPYGLVRPRGCTDVFLFTLVLTHPWYQC